MRVVGDIGSSQQTKRYKSKPKPIISTRFISALNCIAEAMDRLPRARTKLAAISSY